MNYVDGFVVPVPKAKLAAYRCLSGMSPASVPFDGKQMIFGCFKPMLKL
ncbi:MAG TPA: hypothetical protein VJR95_07735 [Rhodanobacter sp.]|nr:hypothetical protein [Rhodanobacter sp.]